MNKRKGFTLIEVIVSLFFISIVMILTFTVSNKVYEKNKTTKDITKMTFENTGEFERCIEKADEFKEYYLKENKKLDYSDKPKHYVEPTLIDVDFKIMNKSIKKVKGYNLSFEKTSGSIWTETISGLREYKKNIDLKNDKTFTGNLYTFVAIGKEKRPVAQIGTVSIKNPRFEFFPLDDSSKKLEADFAINLDHADMLKNVRLYLQRSKVSNGDSFLSPYVTTSIDNDLDDKIQNVFDTIETKTVNEGEGSGDYEHEFKGRIGDLDEYLKNIDTTIKVAATTLNKDGTMGAEASSITNSEKDKAQIKYYIGLPFIENLAAFYDFNLFISKDKDADKNDYYSLFDDLNKDKTYYGGLLEKHTSLNGKVNNKIKFTFKNNNEDSNGIFKNTIWDVRDFLEIGEKNNRINFKMPDGFFIENKENQGYGNTLYFNMEDTDVNFQLKNNNNELFLVKYNPKNYPIKNEKYEGTKNYPYLLLGSDYESLISEEQSRGSSIEFKKIESEPYTEEEILGFRVYVNENGDIKGDVLSKGYVIKTVGLRNVKVPTLTIRNEDFINEDLKLDNSVLYNSISYKRDFNIMAAEVRKLGSSVQVNLNLLVKDDKKTQLKNIVSKTFNTKIDELHFGKLIKLNEECDLSVDKIEKNESKSSVMEIQDIVFYDDFTEGEVGIDILTNYLYRKTLNENERMEFDDYYKSLIR